MNSDAEKYLFFFGHRASPDGTITESCLSQWYDCRFTENGISYHTAEQYMMAGKARLFGDDAAFSRIMSAQAPSEYKRLGRIVKHYSEAVWQASRFDIVVKGNLLKFGQNEALKRFLLETGDKILAEASAYDLIWGIGLPAYNPDINDPSKWRGQNLLGQALMTVRDALRKAQ